MARQSRRMRIVTSLLYEEPEMSPADLRAINDCVDKMRAGQYGPLKRVGEFMVVRSGDKAEIFHVRYVTSVALGGPE